MSAWPYMRKLDIRNSNVEILLFLQTMRNFVIFTNNEKLFNCVSKKIAVPHFFFIWRQVPVDYLMLNEWAEWYVISCYAECSAVVQPVTREPYCSSTQWPPPPLYHSFNIKMKTILTFSKQILILTIIANNELNQMLAILSHIWVN